MIALTRTATEALAIVLAVWLTVGLTLGVVMGRRGHASFQWLFVGAALGPLALPLAWAAVRDEQHRTRELTEGVPGGGTVDVLVGIDGSPESEVALRSAVQSFGTRIGRLTLARVVDFDNTSQQAREDAERAIRSLEASVASTDAHEPGTILLSGQPAEALTKHASEEGYELLVIGRRGRGASNTFLGSTASRVANGSDVPVLIV